MEIVEKLTVENIDNLTLQRLCGTFDQNLEQIGKKLHLQIIRQHNQFFVKGKKAELGIQVIRHLLKMSGKKEIHQEDIHFALISAEAGEKHAVKTPLSATNASLHTNRLKVEGRTPNQNQYISALLNYDIVFGLGPAGTGKTYLAVAAAVEAMQKRTIQKIILVRPVVEAGEKLGFLPGDVAQKIDPYLRPLYDALYDFMGIENVNRLIEKGVIELVPLAYMRGRTLNNAFIILDEAQNTTKEQMKMFLTRLGFESKAAITGDLTQIDLPASIESGLQDAYHKLKNIEGIYFHQFESIDIVRHPLVQKIVDAYTSSRS